jgi:hypothetical protein
MSAGSDTGSVTGGRSSSAAGVLGCAEALGGGGGLDVDAVEEAAAEGVAAAD